MLKQLLYRLTAGAMIIVFPATMMLADTGTAMLSSGQNVMVNGRKAQGRQAIMPGDAVRNNGTGTALLATPGAAITVGERSEVVYGNDGIRVTSGAASLKSHSQILAKFDEISVRPATADSQFVIGEIGGKRIIAAVHGALVVTDGVNEYTLPEGKALTQDKRPTPPLAGKDAHPDTPKSGEERRGGKRVGGAVLPGWAEVLIIGGAIAGVLGGLGAAGYFEKASGQ